MNTISITFGVAFVIIVALVVVMLGVLYRV